jgi:ketosteroid isomerase-like protein
MHTSANKPVRRSTADEGEIRKIMAEQAAAMRRGDAAAIVARYAPEVVKYDLAPPLRQTAEELLDVDALRGWFDGHGGAVDYEIRDLEVVVDGDLACAHALHRMGASHGSGRTSSEEPFTLWFRVTTIFRRLGDDWKVVHEHESTPLHMDGSFRAAVDLKP